MNQLTLSTDVNTGQLIVTDNPFSGNTTLSIDPMYDSSKAINHIHYSYVITYTDEIMDIIDS